MGSSKKKIEDIFPCLMVGYNQSGSVEIRNGYLMYAGQKMYSLKEIARKATNETDDPGRFYMETGRVIYPCLRICNRAVRCNRKSLGTITITSARSQIKTSVSGSPLEFSISKEITKRDVSSDEIIVTSPNGKFSKFVGTIIIIMIIIIIIIIIIHSVNTPMERMKSCVMIFQYHWKEV